MENISLKLEKEFRKAMEETMRKHNYMTKTEFIREAIREKMKKLEDKPEKTQTQNSNSAANVEKHIPSYI